VPNEQSGDNGGKPSRSSHGLPATVGCDGPVRGLEVDMLLLELLSAASGNQLGRGYLE
jgi:hypothetical protein